MAATGVSTLLARWLADAVNFVESERDDDDTKLFSYHRILIHVLCAAGTAIARKSSFDEYYNSEDYFWSAIRPTQIILNEDEAENGIRSIVAPTDANLMAAEFGTETILSARAIGGPKLGKKKTGRLSGIAGTLEYYDFMTYALDVTDGVAQRTIYCEFNPEAVPEPDVKNFRILPQSFVPTLVATEPQLMLPVEPIPVLFTHRDWKGTRFLSNNVLLSSADIFSAASPLAKSFDLCNQLGISQQVGTKSSLKTALLIIPQPFTVETLRACIEELIVTPGGVTLKQARERGIIAQIMPTVRSRATRALPPPAQAQIVASPILPLPENNLVVASSPILPPPENLVVAHDIAMAQAAEEAQVLADVVGNAVDMDIGAISERESNALAEMKRLVDANAQLQQTIESRESELQVYTQKMQELAGVVTNTQRAARDTSAQLEETVRTIQDLDAEKAILLQRIAEAEVVNARVEQLQTEISELQEGINTRDTEIQRLGNDSQMMQEMETQISKLEDMVVDRDAQIDELKVTRVELEAEIQTRQQEIEGLEESVDEMKSAAEEMTNDLNRTKEVYEQSQLVERELNSQIENLTNIINGLREQADINSEAVETLRAQIKDGVEARAATISENESLRDMELELQDTIAERDATIQDLQDLVDRLRDREEQLKTTITAQEMNLRKASTTIQSMQASMQQELTDTKKRMNETMFAQAASIQQTARLQSSNATAAALAESKRSYDRVISTMQAAEINNLAEIRDLKMRLDNSIASKSTDVAQVSAEVNRLQSQLSQTNEEANAVRSQLQQSAQELQEWKLRYDADIERQKRQIDEVSAQLRAERQSEIDSLKAERDALSERIQSASTSAATRQEKSAIEDELRKELAALQLQIAQSASSLSLGLTLQIIQNTADFLKFTSRPLRTPKGEGVSLFAGYSWLTPKLLMSQGMSPAFASHLLRAVQ